MLRRLQKLIGRKPNESSEFGDPNRLQALVDGVPRWWHSLDLGKGVVTRGFKTPECLRQELESLRLPNLQDKLVLDIGAWDGFYSFEAERRGAKRVVALDHYVWSVDWEKALAYRQHCERRMAGPHAEFRCCDSAKDNSTSRRSRDRTD